MATGRPSPSIPSHEPLLRSSRRKEAQTSRAQRDQSLLTSAATVQGFNARSFASGGSVAAIAGSIFLPDTMIISSGYSVASNKFFRLDVDQAWWPGSSLYWDKEAIKTRLKNNRTICYFLFGKKEVDDIYGLETKYFYTENFFKDLPNVKVRYSDNKHSWFKKEISEILAGK